MFFRHDLHVDAAVADARLGLVTVIGGFLVGVFENLVGTYIPGVGNELKLPIALALIVYSYRNFREIKADDPTP